MRTRIGQFLVVLAFASMLGGCSKCGWDFEGLIKPLPKSCTNDSPQR